MSGPINDEVKYREESVPLLRKVIAKRMLESKTTAPHFYLSVDADMKNLVDLRNELNKLFFSISASNTL